MLLDSGLQVFLGGAVGWLIIEVAKFGLAAITGKKIDGRYTTVTYWLGAIALAFVAGFFAVMNGTEHVKLSQAVQFGINAPAIVSGLASSARSARRRRNAGTTLGVRPGEANQQQIEENAPSFLEQVLLCQAW